MKLVVFHLTWIVFVGTVTVPSTAQFLDLQKRIGSQARAGINRNPSLFGESSSHPLSRKPAIGDPSLYGVLDKLTSGRYKILAGFIYNSLEPLNGLLNPISCNVYKGLSGPPGVTIDEDTTDITDRIFIIIDAITGGGGGIYGNILSNLINLLLRGFETSGAGVIGPLGSTVAGNVNATLNLPLDDFSKILTDIGQNMTTLAAELQTQNKTTQNFVDGYLPSGLSPKEYLKSIFNPTTKLLQELSNSLNKFLTGLLGNSFASKT